jgi:glycosyltransferase involved in cell wall biosynthesis
MKILVVSNLYPPHYIGGYELGCRDVVEALRARGHQVNVLTSAFRLEGTETPANETGVARVLTYKWGKVGHLAECRKMMAALRRFAPDVVYFWNLAGMSMWLPFTAWYFGYRMAFFLSDTNFVSWRIAAWLAGPVRGNPFLKKRLGHTFLACGWPVIQNRTCHFASDFLRSLAARDGIVFAPDSSFVAHWGIQFSQFMATPRERWPAVRLLFSGQLIEQKGAHTAIKALALLAREPGFSRLTLTVVGGGMQPNYEKNVRALPAELGIADRVQFLGKIPRAELSRVYAEHDVLVFPSEWEEPFALTPLEAMHCGLAVVGTTTGGSGELFRDRETAMTFQAGDAADCAHAIRELCGDRELFEAISRKAREVVHARHTLAAMVDRIEKGLQSLSA